MLKKSISFLLCLVLSVVCCIGVMSCTKGDSKQTESAEEEIVDDFIDNALEETDLRLDDYIDVSHFVELEERGISTTGYTTVSNDVENDTIAEQNEELKTSISEIFDELTEEEYDSLKTLGEEDSEIAEMLYMVESDFAGYDDKGGADTACEDNITLLSSAVATIGSILLRQGVSNIAVVAIKGAFNAMIKTLKAFFLPKVAKVAIITATILVIATVVIINWSKIKSVFNNIVNIFVSNARQFATNVRQVFNTIFNRAQSAENTKYSTIEGVIDNDATLKGELHQLNAKPSEIKKILLRFLGLNALSQLYNRNNKVLCIGRDIAETYNNSHDMRGYQNYATLKGFMRFFHKDYLVIVSNRYNGDSSLINYANKILVYFCCYNDWDFILVTTPYYYMAEHLDLRYSGYSYSEEIALIRRYGYNIFWNGVSSWSAIRCPGTAETDYYAFAGYRVSR